MSINTTDFAALAVTVVLFAVIYYLDYKKGVDFGLLTLLATVFGIAVGLGFGNHFTYVENIVAIDGIAVVVDPSNAVDGLSKDDLTGIYDGSITNWKDVGGSDMPIVVVGREAGSGTRGAFEELLGLEDACKYANELDSTGAVMAKVASTPGSIGYVSLDVVDDTVKAVKLDDVEPTEENIKAGSYFLSRPFVMATKGEISEQNELVQALFDYVYSAEGDDLIKSVGLITTK